MQAPGAHLQQGCLSGELHAEYDVAADCDDYSLLEHCRSEGLALSDAGVCADAQRPSGQAEQAARTKHVIEEEGWSEFMG